MRSGGSCNQDQPEALFSPRNVISGQWPSLWLQALLDPLFLGRLGYGSVVKKAGPRWTWLPDHTQDENINNFWF